MIISVNDISTQRLCIGYEGEQNHIQVVFDCGVVFAEYPEAYAQMAIKPPKGNIYPKTVTRDGDSVVWNVGAADCANPGNGEYQITFTNGSTVVKSYIGFFAVRDSLVANGEAPEPVEDWLEQVEAALAAFDGLTASAETLPAGSAATAQITMVNGHKNVLIGVPEGEQGEQGEPGEDGADGKDGKDGADGAPGKDGKDGADGYTPVRGTDYWTNEDKAEIVSDAAGAVENAIIDDTAGTGDTGKVWSADKSASEKSSLYESINTTTAMIADAESSTTAAYAHAVKTVFILNNKLLMALSAIAVGDTITTTGATPNAAEVTLAESFPHDVQVNGTSVVTDGVANVPQAANGVRGVIALGDGFGLKINSTNGTLQISSASVAECKNPPAGRSDYKPVTTYVQHTATFYGLAKAAGDSTQSASSNAVGTYTESAKSAISQMLDAPETVSGSTPSITAKPGVRYVCGECATLTIVAPASGCIDVTFDSGSTPTVLTVTPPTGMTMKWIGDDPTALEANKTYEVNIKDGCLGMVVSWT